MLEDGVWRTVGGRRIFIKDGESLASAMKKSGKFTLDDEYDRAHGAYKKEEKEINERNKKLHRKAIEEERKTRFKEFEQDLREQVKEYMDIPEEERVQAYIDGKDWRELVNEKRKK